MKTNENNDSPETHGNKATQTKLNNSRILTEVMASLGGIKTSDSIDELPLDSVHVHLLDEAGDGVALVIHYESVTAESAESRDVDLALNSDVASWGKMRLRKEIYNLEDYYDGDENVIEVELEEDEFEDEYDMELESILKKRVSKKDPLLN